MVLTFNVKTGVGTYRKIGQPPPKVTAISTLRDLAFAASLHVHIQAGYRFVMDNCKWPLILLNALFTVISRIDKEGDKICLFGYSRGGYIARALAGMLHKVGLLPSGNKQQIPFAYDKYKDTSKEGQATFSEQSIIVDKLHSILGRDLSDLYVS